MRILHVYKDYFPESQGGLEEVIRQICRNSTREGFENRVLTLGPGGAAGVLEREEATVVRYRRDLELASCGMSLSALMAFRREAEAADVVHYHFPWPFADLMHVARRVRTPSVVTYHSDIVRQKALMRLYAPLMRRFFDRVDAIVATSPNYFASSEILQATAEKVDVIPIGIDESVYPTPEEADRTRWETELGRDFFLFVGVLRYYKGLHILLDAVANTDLRVVIAGAGPVEAELRAHAGQLGLDNVCFVGHVSDADKVVLFELARAVVFPSHLRSEAFGVTLIEGAMFGKPLISTEIGTGTTYVNVHGETGLVVSPGDSKGLRSAMVTLARDPEFAGRLGRGAYERYRRLFMASVMGERYTALYRRLAPPGPAADSTSHAAALDAGSRGKDPSDS